MPKISISSGIDIVESCSMYIVESSGSYVELKLLTVSGI